MVGKGWSQKMQRHTRIDMLDPGGAVDDTCANVSDQRFGDWNVVMGVELVTVVVVVAVVVM